MTQPNERTKATIFAYEFLQKLAAKRIPGVTDEIQREAEWLLRHFPQPYEIRMASQHDPSLFGEPNNRYPTDSHKQSSVGNLVLQLARFDPALRAVVAGSGEDFEDVQSVLLVPDDAGQAVLIAGKT